MLSLSVVGIHSCVSIYFFVLVLSLFIFYIPFLFIVTTIHSRIAHSFPLSITYYPFNPIPYLPVLFYAHCLRMVVLKGSPKFKFGSLKFPTLPFPFHSCLVVPTYYWSGVQIGLVRQSVFTWPGYCILSVKVYTFFGP